MDNFSFEEYLNGPIQFWQGGYGIEWEYPASVWNSKAIISSKKYYEQFITYPKDVQKYDSSHRCDSWNHD